MSQYISLGLTCAPGQIHRSGPPERCVSAKGVAQRAAAAAAVTTPSLTSTSGGLGSYKWLLIGGLAAVGMVLFLKHRKKKGAAK